MSSLHIFFSLCARVGLRDVCLEFTNLIKVDVDVDEMSLLMSLLAYIMFEKQLTALHVVRMFHLFNRCVFILLTKMRTRTKTIPST